MTQREQLIKARFWSKVEPTGFCWNWTGKTSEKTGHGRFNPERTKSVAAHRFAYELLVGPIPEGLDLDHLCRHPPCVNPDHMDPVTNRENVLRGFGITAMQARQTHCVRGHEFTPENTHITKRGMRHCRTCSRARTAEWAKEKIECPNCGKILTRKNMKRHIALMHA